MAFTSYNRYSNIKKIIWQHRWSDGSRLELTQDRYDWILIEYDSDGDPIPYAVSDGYSNVSSIEERYAKKDWTLNDVIQDIKEEYDMRG